MSRFKNVKGGGEGTYIPSEIIFNTDAAYRFYRSKSEEESARRRGKLGLKNKSKRRHERLVRVSY